jgi:thioredoxin reductase (NADPH)
MFLDVKQDKVTGVQYRTSRPASESVLDCAGVFVAIGHVPNTQIFKGVIEMDENGYIIPRKGTTPMSQVCSWRVIVRPCLTAGRDRRRDGLRGRHRCERYLSGIDL